jgi:hypothetical protein
VCRQEVYFRASLAPRMGALHVRLGGHARLRPARHPRPGGALDYRIPRSACRDGRPSRVSGARPTLT